ncbi:MAG: hypothetical protein ACYCT0_01870 [Sulfobacillus sp.]
MSVSWISDSGLKVLVEPAPMTLPQDIEALVEEHWAVIAKGSPHYFRGPVLSIGSIARSGLHWSIHTQFTDYAHYLYSRCQLPVDHPYKVRVIFAAALVVTRDRYLIAGVMGPQTARPGWVQSIGGSPIFEDVVDGVFDPRRSASKELKEETGLVVAALNLSRAPEVLGCTVDGNGSVAVAVGYRSTLTAGEVIEAVDGQWQQMPQSSEARELDKLVAIPLGWSGIKWLRTQPQRHVRYLERLVLELDDWRN